MEKFTLRATLRSPIIRRGFVTLDALLMALLERGDVSDLIRCENELYFASAGFASAQGLKQQASFVASLRPEHTTEWLEVIKPNTSTPGIASQPGSKLNDVKIGLSRQREGGNVLNGYEAIVTPTIEWYGTGHPQAILGVVSETPFIGKKRTAGYGEVVEWAIEPGDLDGICGHFGEPLRPIPTERWSHGGDWIPVEAAWKAPYWDVRNRTKCYVPEAA